jgi:hypothetical protein
MIKSIITQSIDTKNLNVLQSMEKVDDLLTDDVIELVREEISCIGFKITAMLIENLSIQ